MHKIPFNKPLLTLPTILMQIIKYKYKNNNVITGIQFQEMDAHKTVEKNIAEMG
jgi:hypothetical protein